MTSGIRARRLTGGHALVALACVLLAAVVAGAHELWGVFDEERTEAEARVADEQRLIEDAARNVVIDDIERKLAVARLHSQAIFDDPLRDDEGLVLVTDGKQFLPRTSSAPPASRSFVAHFDASVRSGAKIQVQGALGELLEKARAVVAAKDDDARLVAAVRDYLEHRAHTKTSGSADATLTLLVVDTLLDRGDADAALLRAVLRDGSAVGGVRVRSVQQTALEARPILDAADADFLRAAVVSRCARAGVDSSAFEERWAELARPPLKLPPIPGAPIGVALAELPGELVVLRHTGHETSMEGLRVPLKDALLLVDNDLKKRGLLRGDETVALAPAGGEAIVNATLRSPRLDAARARIAERHEAKRTLLVVTGALAFGIVFAAGAELRRRRRYEDLRTGFLAAVSHELRTPLASMRLLVESMLARATEPRTAEKLQRLGKDVDGLDFLVENILSFSRLERGRLEPRRERTSLGEIAAEAAERARLDGGVDVAVTLENEGLVEGDPELLGLVVSNLVRNAWQHNPRADRTVQVTVRAPAAGPREVRVEVRDNGPGVAADDRERIFAEFVRGARPTTRGTGLGLALCRQIARVHGGDVALERTGADGSTFVLTLPTR